MFRSFLGHHQVHKELKYAASNKIIVVRDGIPLGLHLYGPYDGQRMTETCCCNEFI